MNRRQTRGRSYEALAYLEKTNLFVITDHIYKFWCLVVFE